VGDSDNPLPTLIQNIDPTNVVYLGETPGINPAQPNTCAPLSPGQTSVASGDINVFGIAAPGQTVSVNVYRGLMSFFQPLSQLVIAGPNAGIFLYSPTPGLGNLIGSWSSVAGTDPYGNLYPSGLQVIANDPNAQNVFTILDGSGSTLLSVDGSGNLQANSGNFSSLSVNGQDLFNDIIGALPQGVINRGWIGTPPWPATPIGTTDTPLLELDAIIPVGREYRFKVMPATILMKTAPTAPTQYVQHIRYTTDGSTPSTATPEPTGHGPMVTTIPVASLTNYLTPGKEFIIGNSGSVDTQYRMLITGNVQSGTFQFATFLECLWEDLGPIGAQFANSGTVLGSGTSGGGSKQTYTKNYVATEFAVYYGDTASYGSGPYSQRSYNASTMYQGAASGYVNLSGDQFSFARFNYGQIATDLGAGVVNWVKLRLTNEHFWYNGGGNAVVGWSSYTGAYGSSFVPGAGTHENTDHYHMNEGATVTHQMSSAMVSAITSGFTSIILGPSASYTSRGDLNNYGYWAGAGNVNTAPQLTINYTK
jgi:hypothetical protein